MMINILLYFFVGLIFGSFLNSLVYRLYYDLSIWSRSLCPICKTKLQIRDLIPLLSFVILKAKCRFCKRKISWQYFFIELSTGFLFVLVFLKYGAFNLFLLRDLFFVFILFFIFIFDFKYYLILANIVLPVFVISFFINLLLGFLWWNLLLAIFIGGGFFLLQFILTRGKGIGFGDIGVGILIGAMFGWQLTILIIIIAYLIGGLIALILLISKKKKFGDVLPMGSFLAVAAIIVLFFGNKILDLIF